MRIAVLLLILANVLLFAYSRLDAAASSEAGRLDEQVHPDHIKLLSPQQVATLGPARLAALTDVCIEWGPFSDADRARAQAELEPLQPGGLVTVRPVDADSTWWVNAGPYATRSAADRRAGELRSQGVNDLSVVDSGNGQFTVSLGVFRTEAAADARAAALTTSGVKATRVEPRQPGSSQSMLVLRNPSPTVMAALKALQAQYTGSEVKPGACSAAP